MKLHKILFLILTAGVLLAPSMNVFAADKAAATPAAPAAKTTDNKSFGESPWATRCNKNIKDEGPKRGRCEIFKVMAQVEKKQRLVEVAVGFPADKTTARGIFVVPLGILLQAGMQMKIDDGKPFKFQARFCDNGGCYGYVDLNDDILNTMRKGTKLTISFEAVNQKVINVEMSLKDFGTALKDVS